jgi:hypothetical protein
VAPTLALVSDTGSSNTDKITSSGVVNVTGLESGATWEYSSNGGTSWTAGTGSSFTLIGDGAKSVIVRQTDAAGNVSAASTSLGFTLDTSAAAPTLALASDTGSSNTDKITSSGVVNVTGLESGATWEYSTNSGTSWTAGTGSSFTLGGDGSAVCSGPPDRCRRQCECSFHRPGLHSGHQRYRPHPGPGQRHGQQQHRQDHQLRRGQRHRPGEWGDLGISTNGGTSSTAGTGTSFALAGDGANSVQVRQTDAAGNVSTASTALGLHSGHHCARRTQIQSASGRCQDRHIDLQRYPGQLGRSIATGKLVRRHDRGNAEPGTAPLRFPAPLSR